MVRMPATEDIFPRKKSGIERSKIIKLSKKRSNGRGVGQGVSALAVNTDNPSLNPAEVYSFSVKFVFDKNEYKQKEVGIGPFLRKDQNTQKERTIRHAHFITRAVCSSILVENVFWADQYSMKIN